jgi:hypothetical protein
MAYQGKAEHNEVSKPFLEQFPEAATAFMRNAMAQAAQAATDAANAATVIANDGITTS